jgi:hypothetical protein
MQRYCFARPSLGRYLTHHARSVDKLVDGRTFASMSSGIGYPRNIDGSCNVAVTATASLIAGIPQLSTGHANPIEPDSI